MSDVDVKGLEDIRALEDTAKASELVLHSILERGAALVRRVAVVQVVLARYQISDAVRLSEHRRREHREDEDRHYRHHGALNPRHGITFGFPRLLVLVFVIYRGGFLQNTSNVSGFICNSLVLLIIIYLIHLHFVIQVK